MSRIQQDQFIDEDEEDEVCPLCVEEFDLGDRYFKPCPCGYQICQFCYNNIKTTMNGLCPACRRPYDDKPFSFKNVTQEELLQHEKNKAAQQKKRAAAKQKEAQKREADNLSRKHLAGLRVRQRNLVYVTGMRPKIQGDRVAELLRGKEYFGQYGDIIKVVVSKAKDAAHTPNQPVGIYVTFARKEDAAACIEAINAAAQSGDGKIRAQHGTTKYCSAYLRGETCNNRNCMFLHEPGESAESFTRQDLSNMNAISTQQPSSSVQSPPQPPPPQHTQPVAAAAQDQSPTSPTGGPDTSALPAGANWARRGSRATSSSVASPVVTNTIPAQTNESKPSADSSTAKSTKDTSSDSVPSRPASSASTSKPRKLREQSAFHNLLKVAFNPNMKFNFSPYGLSDDDIKLLNTLPPLWDPQGGIKRRLMKERDAEELRKQEEATVALQDAPKGEVIEQPEMERGGSLQLGGEPEERPERAFGQQSAIQPPSGYPLGQQFALDNDLAGLSIRGATPTQHHQSQLLLRQLQSAGTSQHQTGGHGRQPSRFTFNEAGGLKAAAGLQQPKALAGFNAPGQQVPFYSGVQGPPPGLKTTGTPPVNGGSMFGQGHGFTSGYGASAATRDADRAWDVRGQRGAQDAGKREFMFPFSHNTSTSSTPAPGHMGYPYGSQPGGAAFQENGGPQKQKKKGKKHRHANTSSSGGGVVDAVADPSILQARPYQNGTPGLNGGQGLYGAGQGQVDLPALGQSLDPPRRATPTLPPGLFPNIDEPPAAKAHPGTKELMEGTEETEDTSIIATTELPQETTTVEDKAKISTIQPKSPSKSVSRDPTPAESAASKKEPKVGSVKAAKTNPETLAKQDQVTGDSEAKSTPVAKAAVDHKPEPSASKRPHPGNLNILNIDTTPPNLKDKEIDSPVPPMGWKIDTANRSSRAPSISATSLSSRPGTPLMSAVATGSPLKRTVQPRTLRITDTPRTETPPAFPTSTPTVASTPPPVAAAQAMPSKIISRRTSIASLNQPGTPLTDRTDTMSVTSTSVSRASSPPPLMTNKKAKRKEKAGQKKKEKEADVTTIVTSKESTEPVAPIMARKTKSKKSKPATSGPTPVSRPTPPPVIAEEKSEDVARAKAAQQSPTPEPIISHPVSAQSPKPETPKKGKAKAANPAPPPASPIREEPKQQEKKEQLPNQLTAAAILQALESTHQLAVSTLSLLKPLTSQSELKKLGIDPFTSADLQNHIEQLRFELTKADEQLLKQGQAVRKDLGENIAGNGRVSGRCFVTPAGTRLSCLTKEEEEKYVEIEKRVMSERGMSRWGGAMASHITKQALKPKKGKLQNTLAQEDVLRALSIATESLEGALRDVTKGTNVKVEAHLGPAPVHLAGQGVQAPSRTDGHPQDPTMDAREYVNKFVPRLLDANPGSVAVPSSEDDVEDWTPGTPGWNNRRFPVQHPNQSLDVTPQLLADATAAAGLAPRPDLNLPPPSPHLPSSSSSVTDANTAAAMDTLKEAMATAGAIAKLGANEALKSPADILKSWDKAMAATPGGSPKNLQIALEKAVKREADTTSKTGRGQGTGGAAGVAMSMADLEREGLKERVAEAKRDAAEWEKRFNKVLRGNRKMVLGSH